MRTRCGNWSAERDRGGVCERSVGFDSGSARSTPFAGINCLASGSRVGKEGGNSLMKEILGSVGFFQAISNQMRFGEFSRLPIRVERFAIKEDAAECDWFMRPPDPWDVELPTRQREEHLTQQALSDGL